MTLTAMAGCQNRDLPSPASDDVHSSEEGPGSTWSAVLHNILADWESMPSTRVGSRTARVFLHSSKGGEAAGLRGTATAPDQQHQIFPVAPRAGNEGALIYFLSCRQSVVGTMSPELMIESTAIASGHRPTLFKLTLSFPFTDTCSSQPDLKMGVIEVLGT